MTNVAHSTLTGSNLHENKGVSSATDNTVATASSGVTVWQKLTASNLTGTGNAFGAQLLQVTEEQPSGNGSTCSFTGGAWSTLVLNTVKTNELSATLSTNRITLAAGTYWAEIATTAPYPTSTSGYGKIRLYNYTDSSLLINGLTLDVGNSSVGITRSPGFYMANGRFTLSGSKTVTVDFYSPATIVSAAGAGASGVNEVFTDVRIWKIA